MKTWNEKTLNTIFFSNAECSCAAIGTEYCDSETGNCICKKNVQGPDCSECKPGYYGYSAGKCISCNCSKKDQNGTCDETGMCNCDEGSKCDKCGVGSYAVKDKKTNKLSCLSKCIVKWDQWKIDSDKLKFRKISYVIKSNFYLIQNAIATQSGP